jgi:hypothetical protein
VGEGEQAAGAQEPGRLGHGPVGVGEQERPVVGEHDVEAGVAERGPLGVGLDQREGDPRLGPQGHGVGELALGQVEADRPGAVAGQGRRPLGAAAAELEDVLAGDVAEHAQLRLGDVPGAPGELAGEGLVRIWGALRRW